jgi:hypothetical protein
MNTSKFSYYSLCAAVLLAFFFGKYLLNDVLGVPYYHEGGNPIFKIHIYSYLLIFSSFYVIFKIGFQKAIELISKNNNYLWFYLLSVLYVAVSGLFNNGIGGMAYVVDTLLMPVFALFLAFNLNDDYRSKLIKLFFICLVINSSVAILEFILHKNFIPRLAPVWDFRSWAFLSHPLNNALITSCLMFLVVYNFRIQKKLFFIMFFVIALLSFGGRVGFILVALVLCFLSLKEMTRFIFHKTKFSYIDIIFIHLFMIFSFVFLAVAFQIGLGARIFGGLEMDGSAQTRLDVFLLFEYITMNELFWGVDKKFYLLVESILGVPTIENTWIAWLFQFGLVASLPLSSSLIYLLYCLSKGSYYLKIVTVLFLIVCSANNSLSTKSPALMFYVLALYSSRVFFEPKENNSHLNYQRRINE